jgi:hypothetical protein
MKTIISHYLIQQQCKNQSLMEDIASQGLLANAVMLQLKKDIHQQQSCVAGLEGMQIYSERAITGILCPVLWDGKTPSPLGEHFSKLGA